MGGAQRFVRAMAKSSPGLADPWGQPLWSSPPPVVPTAFLVRRPPLDNGPCLSDYLAIDYRHKRSQSLMAGYPLDQSQRMSNPEALCAIAAAGIHATFFPYPPDAPAPPCHSVAPRSADKPYPVRQMCLDFSSSPDQASAYQVARLTRPKFPQRPLPDLQRPPADQRWPPRNEGPEVWHWLAIKDWPVRI